jgi:hypothetical protein
VQRLRFVDTKLLTATQTIAKLSAANNELDAIKADVKSSEEEKKSMEVQQKKMRRMMRQSVIS